MLYIALGNSDGGAQIRKVVATNLAARLRRKGGLLTETNTGTERTKLLATVAEASFQGGRISSNGCGKISRPPGARNPDPVPRQLVVTEGRWAPSISNRGQKELRRQSISECEASPHTF